MRWFKPVAVTFSYFVVTPKGVTLKHKRVVLSWTRRLKTWAYLRAQWMTYRAYLTRSLWLD